MKSRALLVALVVALGLAAATLYFTHRSGSTPGGGMQLPIADSTLGGLFGADTGDDHLIGVALMQLERDYYKPIDPQTPFRGVSTALTAYLKSRHLKATLPAEHATGDPDTDALHLESEVGYAQSHYGVVAGDSELLEAALTGMMSSVDDPYTVYLSPREIQQLTETLAGGNFGGIGVYIFPLRNREILIQPIPQLPAARAGITTPLILDSVNATATNGLSSDTVQALIRGAAGTTVTIRAHPIEKAKRVRTYRVVREIIHVPTVHAQMENGIDYIRLSEFGETSAQEMHAALLDGKARGARGYILDFRYNGGGLVDSAVAIVSYFVPGGAPIVSEVNRDGRAETQVGDGATIPGLAPVVILVNKSTASASEITAGALQDYHLATLVGTQTFGKGVVQTIYTMPAGEGALKITIARYVTPKGRDIEHRGIRPDVIVADPNPRLLDTPRDGQLAEAKALIAKLSRATPRS